MLARDKQSHFPNNFVLELSNQTGTIGRLILNALDESQALRIGINRYLRTHKGTRITHARVCDVYDNDKKTVVIKKKIL